MQVYRTILLWRKDGVYIIHTLDQVILPASIENEKIGLEKKYTAD